MEGRVVNREAVIFEHVEEGRLAGVVESQEQDLCALVVEPEEGKDVPEPVEEIHVFVFFLRVGEGVVCRRGEGCA